jgi:hypothetical protein
MPWLDVSLPTWELELADGVVKWNTALQLAMGDPAWVDLLWDAEARTIGIRAVNAPLGIPVVKEPSGSEYKLDSSESLEAVGVPVDVTVRGEPSVFKPTVFPSGWLPGDRETIYYLAVPE